MTQDSRRGRLLAAALATCLGLVLVGTAIPAQAATLTQVTGFGTNPGNLLMYRYVPDGLPANRPVVVAIHGCSQSAALYDNESGWTKWADQHQFALVLPQQQSKNNPGKCFNWFLPGDQTRGQGEALSIRQMVSAILTSHGGDATRVFVTGLSGGGAMTSVMLATYPDVFRGGAVVGGVPYLCATAAGAQTSACNAGTNNQTPQQWGDKVRAASTWTGPWPHVSVWHGTADGTVNVQNLTEIMEQWTNVHGIDQTVDITNTVAGYPHNVYTDGTGTARVETYPLTGVGHGQMVDPGTGAQQCGVAAPNFLDVNICASLHIAQWFGITS
jgi:poly(hydroxyalkanoate) depolymerase family esterase